jgi:hypothetical protein
VAHLASDAQTDPALKKSLSRSFAKVAGVSKRALAGTFQLTRYSLQTPSSEPPIEGRRNGDRYYTEEEDVYVSEWIERRLVCLNDMAHKARRKGPMGDEFLQKLQDFIGPVQMTRDFRHDHKDHPRFCKMQRKKLTSLYPWNSVKGTKESCVCHIHYGAALLLADYHRNSPAMHRNYAAIFSGQRGPRCGTITCVVCKDHPFNGPTDSTGYDRVRTLQHPSGALRAVLCPNANAPGPNASVPCCQGECSKCGWAHKVPRCPAEWSETGTVQWREVVYEQLEGKRSHYTVNQVSGTPRQHMERLQKVMAVLAIHDFIARWQA